MNSVHKERSARKRSLRFACSVAVLATALSVAGPAWGHSSARVESDDSPGPLDIVYALHDHERGRPGRLVLTIGTYERWEDALLEGPARNFIAFEFNLDVDKKRERRVFVRYKNGELVAEMFGPGYGDPSLQEPLAQVDLRRADSHSVTVAFSKRLLRRQIEEYRWVGTASFEDQESADCPTPGRQPPGLADGGYASCADFTRFIRHP